MLAKKNLSKNLTEVAIGRLQIDVKGKCAVAFLKLRQCGRDAPDTEAPEKSPECIAVVL